MCLDVASARERIQAAKESGNLGEMQREVGDLRNLNYPRTEALALLEELLRDQSWTIRVQAAQIMADRGSQAGMPTLHAAVRAAAEGEVIPPFAVEGAASTLHQFRQRIDSSELVAAFQSLNSSELCRVAAAQGAPEMAELCRRQEIGPWVGVAGLLRLRDPSVINAAQRSLEGASDAKVFGHWILYRVTDDEAHLDYLVEVVRERVGLAPDQGKSEHRDGAFESAFGYLQIAKSPRAVVALREVADHVAASPQGNNLYFGRAFISLFYVQRDTEYVDRKVIEFLRDDHPGPGVDREVMWNIAAHRRTPEMIALAKDRNRMLYVQQFILEAECPPEKWAPGSFLMEIPFDVLPPVGP